MIRVLLSICVFIGAMFLLNIGFALAGVKVNFSVGSYQITNLMVMGAIAMVFAVMTFKKTAE